MASINFIDQQTVIPAGWLNEVNNLVHTIFNNPADAAAARAAITAASTDELNSHAATTTGVHGVTGNIVGTSDSQTLTNKTLTTPVISQILNTGTLTLPTSTTSLIGNDTSDTLTNKTIVVANNTVTTAPSGSLSATELNAALAELEADKVPRTSTTGSAVIPAGTTAQRDGSPVAQYIRFNTDTNKYEGYYGAPINDWQELGGGQMLGTAATKAIFYNAQTIAEDITVAATQNALSAGPIEIADTFTVTVADGAVWTIV